MFLENSILLLNGNTSGLFKDLKLDHYKDPIYKYICNSNNLKNEFTKANISRDTRQNYFY
ncbi:hypothetical protein GCM10022393_26150 [Aquimarina addita]|uniref:Uncharacterized protein n=1 Tax=Aquimarina addita TaxID=870485 RepID=A0ABP6ULI3_9FLAO